MAATRVIESACAVRECSSGTEHFAIVLADGSVFSWGRRGHGRLGLPDEGSSSECALPTRIASLSGIAVRRIACGGTHTVAVTEDGAVVAWGTAFTSLRAFECLDAYADAAVFPWKPGYIRMPVRIASVSCGWEFAVGLTRGGRAWAWGANDKGQLGFHDPTRRIGGPVEVDAPPRVRGSDASFASVSCGGEHCCAVTSTGVLYSWGGNAFGQCGQGHWAPVAPPRRVGGAVTGLPVHAVACGQHTLAIAGPRRQIFAWGSGCRGQLGGGIEKDACVPAPVRSLASLAFEEVHCGDFHSVAIGVDLRVFAWGSNLFGEIAQDSVDDDGSSNCASTPVLRGALAALCAPGGEARRGGVSSSSGGGGGGGSHEYHVACGGIHTLLVRAPLTPGSEDVNPSNASHGRAYADRTRYDVDERTGTIRIAAHGTNAWTPPPPLHPHVCP